MRKIAVIFEIPADDYIESQFMDSLNFTFEGSIKDLKVMPNISGLKNDKTFNNLLKQKKEASKALDEYIIKHNE